MTTPKILNNKNTLTFDLNETTQNKNRNLSNSLLGVSPHKAHIKMNGELVAIEGNYDHLKSVGRTYNFHDNMLRKFHVKGFSPKTKMDMYDLMML